MNKTLKVIKFKFALIFKYETNYLEKNVINNP